MCKTRFGSEGVILEGFQGKKWKKLKGTQDPRPFMENSIKIFHFVCGGKSGLAGKHDWNRPSSPVIEMNRLKVQVRSDQRGILSRAPSWTGLKSASGVWLCSWGWCPRRRWRRRRPTMTTKTVTRRSILPKGGNLRQERRHRSAVRQLLVLSISASSSSSSC